jgi:hypothetical protein
VRLVLSCNAGGDIRLQSLRDKVHSKVISAPKGAVLVCSPVFQDLRKRIKKRYRPGYGYISGRNVFGKVARTTIREAGSIIDRAPTRRVLFLTGTLPGSTESAFKSLAAHSGWVVAVLSQWLRDAGCGPKFFGVWELQKRRALHLHLCVELSSESLAAKIKSLWRKRWITLLMGVMRRSKTNVFQKNQYLSWLPFGPVVRTDAQYVEKSVSRYLSKYLSKGSRLKMQAACYPPSRWWFCSRNLRLLLGTCRLRTEVKELPSHLAREIFQALRTELGVQTSKVFDYQPRFDWLSQASVALLSPIHASMLYTLLSSNLSILGRSKRAGCEDYLPRIVQLARLFGPSSVTSYG